LVGFADRSLYSSNIISISRSVQSFFYSRGEACLRTAVYCLIYFTCVPLSAPTRVSVIARSQLLDHDPGTVCQYTFANMTSTLDNFFRPQKTYFIVRADSRHQRLVTPCFRRWVQIISLTYLHCRNKAQPAAAAAALPVYPEGQSRQATWPSTSWTQLLRRGHGHG